MVASDIAYRLCLKQDAPSRDARVSRRRSLLSKRPGREADHSPPPSIEVKHEWSYTSVMPSWQGTGANIPNMKRLQTKLILGELPSSGLLRSLHDHPS